MYFSVNPYLPSLVDLRNLMLKEAEAVINASKGMKQALELCLTLSLILIISVVEFGVVNAAVSGLADAKFRVAMMFDSDSLAFPIACLGLYTHVQFQTAQIIGSLPFLLMIFLRTTLCPLGSVPI